MVGRGERVILGPSGTEPKLKIYLETRAPLTEGTSSTAHASAQSRLDELAKWARDLVGG